MCIMCEMRDAKKRAETQEKKGDMSIQDKIKFLESSQETFELVVKKNHNNLVDTFKEFGELIGARLNVLSNRIEDIENKAMFKPDYNPSEVAFNQLPKEGSFEWAIMQMKKGKQMHRDGEDYYYYFTQLGSFIQVDASYGTVDEDKLTQWEIDTDDLVATDWKVKE